jgi:2-polyprenyl-6-methoxyphenol hydroxylase-like FAD-dependent oxidoreductase
MNGLKAVVVGAGIGGLACAIALRAAGFDVEVYERAPTLDPLGAGICMWPNGAKALHALGLGPIIEPLSPSLNAIHYRTKDGALLEEMRLERLTEVSGTRSYPLARADLHFALLTALAPVEVHLGCECVDVSQDGGSATAVFESGVRASGDVLIGADGVKSVVRTHVLGEVAPRYVYASWVGIVPEDPALTPRDTFTFHVGRPRRTGVLPVSADRMYFFLDAPVREDWTVPGGPMAELAALFSDWADPIRALIERLDEGEVTRLPVQDLEPTDTYVRGRVALIGDAAHATTPTLGQGGALAMEDALVLARYLTTNTISVPDALRRYDQVRRERVVPVVLASHARAQSMVRGEAASVTYDDEIVRNASIPESFVDALAAIASTGPLASSRLADVNQ